MFTLLKKIQLKSPKRTLFYMAGPIAILLGAFLFVLAMPAEAEPSAVSVSLRASPVSGEVPLNNVELLAEVSGTMTGFITYKFDCDSNGTWEGQTTTSSERVRFSQCSYTKPAIYTAKVEVTRGSVSATDIVRIAAAANSANADTLNDGAGQTQTATNNTSSQQPQTNTGQQTQANNSSSTNTTDTTTGNTQDQNNANSSQDSSTTSTTDTPVQDSTQATETGQSSSSSTTTPLPLKVDLAASVSSGTAPLKGVALSATVENAPGLILYKFDCTSNGSWEGETTTSSNRVTFSCDYLEAGTHIASVQVQEGGRTARDTQAIAVTAPTVPGKELQVTVTPFAVPVSGSGVQSSVGVQQVELVVEAEGGTGLITYWIDCENDGIWNDQTTTSSKRITYTCTYPLTPGPKEARVRVEQGGVSKTKIVNINIRDLPSGDPELAVALEATPSSGTAPLKPNLTAQVSGTSVGLITYQFDCDSNGTWERQTTTSSERVTFLECIYSTPNTYVATVKASRGGVSSTSTATIEVKRPVIQTPPPQQNDTTPPPSDNEPEVQGLDGITLQSGVRAQGNTQWQQGLEVDPGKIVEFRVTVENTTTQERIVSLRSIFSSKISYTGELFVNEKPVSASMLQGIQVTLPARGTAVVTYEGKVAGVSDLVPGTTRLVHAVIAQSGDESRLLTNILFAERPRLADSSSGSDTPSQSTQDRPAPSSTNQNTTSGQGGTTTSQDDTTPPLSDEGAAQEEVIAQPEQDRGVLGNLFANVASVLPISTSQVAAIFGLLLLVGVIAAVIFLSRRIFTSQ